MKLTDAIAELKAKIGSETEIGPWLEYLWKTELIIEWSTKFININIKNEV